MKKIEMKYNPFTLKFTLIEDGKELNLDDLLKYNGQVRLQFWVDKLFPKLYEYYNENFEFVFNGTLLDFQDIKFELDDFNKYKNVNITLEHIEQKSVYDKLEIFKKFLKEMQEKSPITKYDTKYSTDDIFQEFNESLNKEFEVAVIGTMNSGKSTLINSLIETKLLPSKTEACTSKIFRIKDDDNAKDISVECRDNVGIIIKTQHKNINTDILEEVNYNDDDIAYIDIKLNIPFVKSDNIQLIFYDTPGTNNALNKNHREKTYNLIDKEDPLILYMLDSGNLETNDNDELLEHIKSSMNKDGKQAKERFIFVINKVDNIDTQRDGSIDHYKEKAIKILKSKGIEKPNIYLTSSYAALLSILKRDNNYLTEDENYTLELFLKKFKNKDFSVYSAVYRNNGKEINEMLEDAQKNNDEYKELLIRTGIPTLEIGIKNYLEKYALVDKMKKALELFSNNTSKKMILNGININIANNRDIAETFKEKIERLNKQLADGDKGVKFINSINTLNISDRYYEEMDDIFKKFKNIFNQENLILSYSKKNNRFLSILKVEPIVDIINNLMINKDKFVLQENEQKQYHDFVENYCTNNTIKFISEIEKIKEDALTELKNYIIKEYQQHIQSLLGEVFMDNLNNNTKKEEEIFKSYIEQVANFSNEFNEFKIVKDNIYINVEKFLSSMKINVVLGNDKINITEYNKKILPYIIGVIDNLYKYLKDSLSSDLNSIKDYFLNKQYFKLKDILEEKRIDIEKKKDIIDNTNKEIEKYNKQREWLLELEKKLKELIEE